MARRKGSKDKKKRKSPGANKLLLAANAGTIGLGGIVGSELAYGAEVRKHTKKADDYLDRIDDLVKLKKVDPADLRVRKLTDKLHGTQKYLNSKTIKIRPRLIGGVGGLAVGGLIGATVFGGAIAASRSGVKDTEEERFKRKSQARKNLSSVNQSSREIRGWVNLSRRAIGI